MSSDFVPDTLLGDIFVSIFTRRREQTPDTSTASVEMMDDGEILHPLKGQGVLPTHTSKDLLSFLTEESARFFTFDCQASRTATLPQGIPTQPLICDACGTSIRKQTHFIRCADCSNPFIDICLTCFVNGAEFGNHKRNHRYAVVKNKLNNRKISKIDLFEFVKFLINCEEKGSLNYSIFEKNVLGIKRAGLGGEDNSSSNNAPRAGRSSGRGVRQSSSDTQNFVVGSSGVSLEDAASKNITSDLNNSDAEKTYLGILSLLTRCSEEDLVTYSSSHVPSDMNGGPGNYNMLRDEFEYEFLPEAETVLAAVTPPPVGSLADVSLGSLLEAYNGIQDERERRKKILVQSHLVNVREFTSLAKKRKTDEKEMFEKVRIFLRPVLFGLDSGEKAMKFLDSFAVALTTRKRTLERMKRLLMLHKHGVIYEDSSVMQFDTDRKKRHDINQRRLVAAGSGGTKIWTPLPAIASDGVISSIPSSPTVRSTRTSGTPLSLDAVANGSTSCTILMNSAIEAFQILPGADTVVDKGAIEMCLEYFIAPEHWKVVEIAIHAMLEILPDMSDEDLVKVINSGILGTTRRFILGAQGLPISGGPGGHLFSFSNPDEIKLKIVHTCRQSRRRR